MVEGELSGIEQAPEDVAIGVFILLVLTDQIGQVVDFRFGRLAAEGEDEELFDSGLGCCRFLGNG